LGPEVIFAVVVLVAASAAAAAAATADAVGLSTAVAELEVVLRVGDRDNDGFDGGEPPPVGDLGCPVCEPDPSTAGEAWCWGNRCSDEAAEPEADAASPPPPPPPPVRWRGLVLPPPCSESRDIISEALPAVDPPPPPARVAEANDDEAAADDDGDSASGEGSCLLEGDATRKRSIGSIELRQPEREAEAAGERRSEQVNKTLEKLHQATQE